jgi:iron complex outermembrane receptor protein
VNQALPGRVDLRVLLAYQPRMATRAYSNAVLVESSGVAGSGGTIGFAAKRVTTDIGYKVGPVTINWLVRYSSELALTGNPTQFFAAPKLPATFYHDLTVSYAFQAAGHSGQAFLNVANLLDQDPRISGNNSSAAPGNSQPAIASDDSVGRYFTVGLRVKY